MKRYNGHGMGTLLTPAIEGPVLLKEALFLSKPTENVEKAALPAQMDCDFLNARGQWE